MEKPRGFLEFGYKQGEKKVLHGVRWDQDAYDFFMVPRYFRDIISYRTGQLSGVHHNEDVMDNLKKYVALISCKGLPEPLSFFEIGSSLMGVIDSLDYFDQIFNELDTDAVHYIGVDNSDMMNHGARWLHPGNMITLFSEPVSIPCSFFFAKGVSLLYAFDNEEDFCQTLKRSNISVFDYTFTKGKKEPGVVGSGKPVMYLSLDKCKKILDVKGKTLILKPSKRKYDGNDDRVTYECIYGDKAIVEKYQKSIKKFESEFKSHLKNAC